MTYTTDQVVQMARKVGVAPMEGWGTDYFNFNGEELTAFANAIERKTLLEAADKLKADSYIDDYGDEYVDISYVDELRRMAGVE